MNTKKLVQLIISLLFSVGALVWVFFSIDEWDKVGAYLSDIRPMPLVLIAVICIVHFVLRAIRWQLLLPDPISGERASAGTLLDAINIGNLATQILPLRAGEFIRPLILSRYSPYPFATGFVSVVVERFFDLSAVLLSFGLMLVFFNKMDSLLVKGAWGLTVLAGALFIFLLWGALAPKSARAFAQFFLNLLPKMIAAKLAKIVDQLFDGLSVLRSPTRLAAIVGLTAVIWVSCYYMYVLFFDAIGMESSFFYGVTMGVVIALAVAAPSAPGFAGVYELGAIMGFGLLGLPEAPAAAYGIISHVYQIILLMILGAISLMRRGLNFKSMTEQSTIPEVQTSLPQ